MKISSLIHMLYAFGAVLAIIGAIRINYKWNMGKEGIDGEIVMWVGGILFLLLGTYIVEMTI
jgi:type IV secretory pathway VirB2 component (pilin)